LLQPAAAANAIAASGSQAAARFAPFEYFIGCPTDRRFKTIAFKVGSSGGFLYFAGTDARRANADLFPHARHNRAQALQVRIPPAPPRIVRVADHVSIVRRFAAEFTLQCHVLPASVFIWAWISCSKYRQTKLLILADPLPLAKRAFASRVNLRVTAFCVTNDFRGRRVTGG